LVKLLSKRNQNLKLQLPQLPQLLPVLLHAISHGVWGCTNAITRAHPAGR
jgi:hypothetical protein